MEIDYNKFIKNNKIIYSFFINNKKEKEYILSLVSFATSLKEKIYCLYNNISHPPCCIICGKKALFNSFDKGYRNFCSKTCSNKHTANNSESYKKSKKTKLEKYGDENYCNIEKSIQTKLEKYGNINNIKKIKETNKQEYNTEYYIQTDQFKQKSKETKLERYGNENYINQSKCKETCLKKYGVGNPSQSKEIKEKISNKLKNKFKDNPEIIKQRVNNFYKNNPDYNVDKDILQDLYKTKSATQISKILGLSDVTVGNKLRKYDIKIKKRRQISAIEEDIFNFIQSNYSGDIIKKDRKLLDGKEIDILIPEFNLAIEINGAYYHSTKFLPNAKTYHKIKTDLCNSKNYQLIHIFDYQWENNKEQIKSFILNKLNIYQQVIFARKCIIKEADKEICKLFYKQNHLQGFANSKYNYGLFYNNQLISLMSFSNPRFDTKYEYELTHFCSVLNTKVIGGASRLFKYFIKSHNPSSILTYCNNNYSNGKLYDILGFKKIGSIQPNYCYTKGHSIVSKLKFKKKYFKDIFDITRTSEEEIAKILKYYKVYDSGKEKYLWESTI